MKKQSQSQGKAKVKRKKAKMKNPVIPRQDYLKKQSQFTGKLAQSLIRKEIMAMNRSAEQRKTKPISDKMQVLGAEGLRLPQSLRSFAMTLVGYLKKQSQFISY